MVSRRLSVCVLLGVSLALNACSTAAPAAQENAAADIAAINTLRENFSKGFNAGDATAVGKLYTSDAVGMQNHQPSHKGRDAIVANLTGLFSQFTPKFELIPEETKTTGNVGFDRGRYRLTVTPKAAGTPAPPTDEGRYLVLLRKESDGQWRLTHDMDNSTQPVAVPAPPTGTKKPAGAKPPTGAKNAKKKK